MPKTCFVIGPIGDPGTPIRAHADDFMKFIVAACPALTELEYDTPIRADSLNEPGRITSQIIKLLKEADLVIADLTENNANVYYELSLRHALGKPVIHMALDGTPLSFDVRDNRTIFYTMHARRVEIAKEELSNQIRRVHEEKYKPMNPILETIGIINLERSADPIQQAVAQLMSMVEGVSGDVQSLRSAMRDLQITNSGMPAGPAMPAGSAMPAGLVDYSQKRARPSNPLKAWEYPRVGLSLSGANDRYCPASA